MSRSAPSVHPTLTPRLLRGPMSPARTTVLVAAVLATACSKKPKGGQAAEVAEPVVAIPLVAVAEKPAPDILTLTGSVVADQSSNVTAATDGKVIRVLVERGSVVKLGEPLVMLDARSAALSAAGIKAQLGAAKAQEQLATDECKRSQALYDKGAITQSQYEREMTSCTAAQQQVAATKAQLDLVGKSIADGVVRAPFAGTVSDKWVSPGEWAAPGMRLVTLVDVEPLAVELSVPERWVPRLALGQDVEVSAIAYPDQKFAAKVTRLGAEISRMTRALTVEAELSPGSSLKPGMFVEAHVTLGQQPMAVVPKKALVKRGTTWRLFVVVKGRLEERVVQLGPELAGDEVALVRGAVKGDKVAIVRAGGEKPGAPTTADDVTKADERVTDGVRVE